MPIDEKTWNAIMVSEKPPIPPGNATLLGLVTDEKANPLQGVFSTLANAGKDTATTNSEGKFEFRNIATGVYTLTCKKQGYKTDVRDIFLESGGHNVTVILETSPVPWKWLAIAGAAIAGVILLIPKPKKAVKKK